MRTTVEMVSEVELKLQVEVPAGEVDREYGRQLEKVRRRARVKGFRPGKAPAAMVEKLYGEHLAQETAVKLIESTMAAALEGVTRDLVGEPRFEPAPVRRGQPMTYDIRVQVKPEIKLASWRGLEVTVAPAAVAPDAVDRELQRIREAHKERIAVEDRGADLGDVLVVDTHGEVEGQHDDRLHAHGTELRLGDEHLLPGLGDQLMGARAGEHREVTLTFPEDYGAEDLRGRTATLEVEVSGHFVDELPDLDDDFAQDVGHDTLEALRAEVAGRLARAAEAKRSRDLEDKVVAVLLERHKFQAPPAMVQAQLDHTARRYVSLFMMQGMPRDQAIDLLRQSTDGLARESERAVKRYLALEALAKQEELAVDDDALDAEIVKRVQEGGPRAQQEYDKEDVREGVRLELREQAALDLLLKHAKITDAVEEPDPGAPGEAPEEPA